MTFTCLMVVKTFHLIDYIYISNYGTVIMIITMNLYLFIRHITYSKDLLRLYINNSILVGLKFTIHDLQLHNCACMIGHNYLLLQWSRIDHRTIIIYSYMLFLESKREHYKVTVTCLLSDCV